MSRSAGYSLGRKRPWRGFEQLEPRAMLSADSTVVFNEVMYHPPGVDQELEWIELYNQMAVDMDLSDWSLDSGVDFAFEPGTVIPGGGYLVVAADPTALADATGFTDALGPYVGRLSNSGERVVLRNNNDRLMDELVYDDAQPWPIAADGSGASLAKHDSMTPSARADRWTFSTEVGGTPGVENFPRDFQPVGSRTPIALDAPWQLDLSGDDLGTAWREPSYDDSGWSTVRAASPSVLISEITTGTPDGIEIQSVAAENVDTAGWVVAVSDSRSDINVVLPTLWELPPTMEPGTILEQNDNEDGPASEYWGDNIAWSSSGAGWVLMLDGQGNVADFVVWEFDDEQLATFDVTVNGTRVTIADVWAGPSFEFSEDGHRTDTIQRMGTADHNSAADFVHASETIGEQNVDLTTPFVTKGISLPGGSTTRYLRTDFDYDAAPSLSELAMDLVVGDGAVFYLNGSEVLRHNMPAGPITHATPALSSVAVPSFEYDIPISADRLRQSGNVLAVEVHQASSNDTDGVFDMKLQATIWPAAWAQVGTSLKFNEIASGIAPTSFQLELVNHGDRSIELDGYIAANSSGAKHVLSSHLLRPGEYYVIDAATLPEGFATVGEELFLYTPGGGIVTDGARVSETLRGRFPDGTGVWCSPDVATFGEANHFDFHDEIVINEIMYHHRPTYPDPDAEPIVEYAEMPEEWIELYNRSSASVDLSYWRLDDAVDFTFPEGTILKAGEYLVVSNDPFALTAKYPDIEIVGPFLRELSNRDDRVVLLDDVGNPADEVHYYDDEPWTRYADGGGSSLELRNPAIDNNVPEAWAPSDEASKSPWNHYTYTMTAIAPVYSPAIYNFHELRLGLLQDGEVLIDNVTVVEDPNGVPRQLIQNGTFTTGTDKWRLTGTHAHSQVITDPDDPANKVFHLVATGPTNYLSNRTETTLKYNGAVVPVVKDMDYQISFDAKWVAGTPQVHTELYYNKVSNTTIIAQPEYHGTPGRQNSTYEANVGPTYADMLHSPAVPAPNEPIDVSVVAADTDGIQAMTLWYSVAGGGWQSESMTPGADNRYTATMPGWSASTIVQFYIEGTDALGTKSTYPAAGRDSRALVKVDDGRAKDDKQNFRMIMTAADAAIMHNALNILSNDRLGGTIIHNESEIFYDAGIRLRGSMFSRNNATRTGFNIKFPADNLFRGIHGTVTVKKPAIREILVKHMNNHAGDIPGSYDDIVHLISHNSGNVGSARLSMTRYGDIYLDSQFDNGSEGTLFKMEGIRVVQATHNGDPEGIKKPFNPIGWVSSYDFKDLGDDQEQYRWSILINRNRDQDDYSSVVAMAKAFGLNGTELEEAVAQTIVVDEWMRVFAMLSLAGIGDTYTQGNPHNLSLYARPEDGRVMAMPWDWDFTFNRSTSSPLWGNKNFSKVIRLPKYERMFYYHLDDLMESTYNTAYMNSWLTHYGKVAGESYASYSNYINSRSTYVSARLPVEVSFALTTNGGADFSVDTTTATVGGTAWYDIDEIWLEGWDEPLDVSWTDASNWEVELPVAFGANNLEFSAFNRDGVEVGSDTVVVTSTSSNRVLLDSLRITEINYNPAPPTEAEHDDGFTDNDDFEFIELQNIGSEPLDLLGVRFTEGIDFEFTGVFEGPSVLITEVGTGTPDWAEIQNVTTNVVDTNGWFVVANHGRNGVSATHETVWNLPSQLDPLEVQYRTDEESDTAHYWDENIMWTNSGDGWLMLVDDQGAVADFVTWGYSEAELAALDITVEGHHITADDLTWQGVPVAANTDRDFTLQRSGTGDHNDASDWEFTDPTGVEGTPNDGMATPFGLKGMQLAPDQFVVVARDISAFNARYASRLHGESVLVAGQYSGKLDNNGERLALADRDGMSLYDFSYNDGDAWPGRADGKGATLEMTAPADLPQINPMRRIYMEDGAHWRSSSEYAGTPGSAGTGLIGDIVVNEVLTHTDPPLLDSIELFNTTDRAIDVGGWYLSDSWGWANDETTGDYMKYRIPEVYIPELPGAVIPAGGYLVLDETAFNPLVPMPGQIPFGLNGAHGDDVWLMEADEQGNLIRFVDHVRFDAAASGESFGRWPNGQGTADLHPMTERTLGAENSGPRVGPLIISEMMVNPRDPDGEGDLVAEDFEFVEIFNPTGQVVDLTNWRLRGDVDFNFDAGTTLAPRGTLVVMPFSPNKVRNESRWAEFCEVYGIDAANKAGFIGGYEGQLNNSGNTIRLLRPDEPPMEEPLFIPRLIEDHVFFDSALPWQGDPNGGGDSVHRLGTTAWGLDASTWEATAPTPGEVDLMGSSASVVGRYSFYNNSAFDGSTIGLDTQDDQAIATDKMALLPGETATLANYTSYVHGINGIMIDLADLAIPTAIGLATFAEHFSLVVGNTEDPASWDMAPMPQAVNVRVGEGLDGSDRITMIWEDGRIANTWLQVRILPTAATGLDQADVFYFGNAVGEVGDAATHAMVTTADEIVTRNCRRGVADLAAIDDLADFNRDRLVNVADRIIARSHRTGLADSLRLITPPTSAGLLAVDQAVGELSGDAILPVAASFEPTWSGEFSVADFERRESKDAKHEVAHTVDRLMAAYGD